MSNRIRFILLFGTGVVFAGILIGGIFLIYLVRDLPSIDQITSRQVSQSTKIYDRTGQVLLYELSAGERRTVIPFEDLVLRYLRRGYYLN